MIVYLYFKDKKKIENCEKNNVFFFYKTRWDSYPGIGEEKKSFLLKN
jgi:hypothetical protein